MNFADALYSVDRKDVSQFKTENDFMWYSIELYKEFFSLFSATISIEAVCETYPEKRKAILFGLLRKTQDISLNYLNLLCNGSIDSLKILSRTSKEIIINALIMLRNYESQEIFDDFIKYSLITEKRYYEMLKLDESNPNMQGIAKNIRERMYQSIDSSFAKSEIDMSSLDIKSEKQNNFWSKHSIFDRFEMVGLERLYNSYRMDCHSIHGNWQNLCFDFLTYEGGSMTINHTKKVADTRSVLPYVLIHGHLFDKVIIKFVEDITIRDALIECLYYCLDEVKVTDERHEAFLVSSV